MVFHDAAGQLTRYDEHDLSSRRPNRAQDAGRIKLRRRQEMTAG